MFTEIVLVFDISRVIMYSPAFI